MVDTSRMRPIPKDPMAIPARIKATPIPQRVHPKVAYFADFARTHFGLDLAELAASPGSTINDSDLRFAVTVKGGLTGATFYSKKHHGPSYHLRSITDASTHGRNNLAPICARDEQAEVSGFYFSAQERSG